MTDFGGFAALRAFVIVQGHIRFDYTRLRFAVNDARGSDLQIGENEVVAAEFDQPFEVDQAVVERRIQLTLVAPAFHQVTDPAVVRRIRNAQMYART